MASINNYCHYRFVNFPWAIKLNKIVKNAHHSFSEPKLLYFYTGVYNFSVNGLLD